MKRSFLRVLLVAAAIICVAVLNQTDIDKVYAKDEAGDIVIVLDPGHGGYDGGAVSPITGDSESRLNWNIAMAMKAELQTYSGVKVYLTRGSAEYQSNVGRASLARELNADLAVSIHNNSSSATSANGVVCYGTVDEKFRDESRKLGNMIASKISELGINKYNGGYAVRESSYSKTSDFYTFIGEGVRAGAMSILIEHCYLTNSEDATYIHNPDNQYKLGVADATAIAEYYGLKKRGADAGTSISLTRTYSAYMIGANGGTYSVSDSMVVSVREDGLITALKAGQATVTCTAQDGSLETVKVTVPETEVKTLVAGSMQNSFLSKEAAFAYDKERLMVKKIYTDGSAEQIEDGYTLGDPVEGVSVDEGNGHIMTEVNVPVTYEGMSCTMRLYHYTKLGQVTGAGSDNYKVVGANSDIVLVPSIYSDISADAAIEADASIVLQEATEAVTEAEKTTEDEGKSVNVLKIVLIVLGVIAGIALTVVVVLLVINYVQDRRRPYRRHRRRRRR